MRQLMPRKKYIGKLVSWDRSASKGIVETSWGLQVHITSHEILLSLPDKHVVFRAEPKFEKLPGGSK